MTSTRQTDNGEQSVSFDEAIFLFKFCLRSVGVLPNTTLVGRHLLFAYFVWASVVHCSMFVVDVIVKLVDHERSPSLETVYETLGTLGVYARFYVLLARRREFTRLLDTCGEFWDYYCDATTWPLVIDYERKLRKLFWLIFCSISIFINLLYGFNAINVSYLSERHANESRILPYRWYGIKDAETVWPSYEIMFAIHITVMFGTGIVSAAVDSALPLLMILCCGYLQVLRKRIKTITERTHGDPVVADYELIDCCKFHQKILDLCSDVEHLGSILFLIELASSGYVLGLIAVKLSSSEPDKYRYLPILIVMLAHILICQWAPDLLADESKDVSTEIYAVSCTFVNRPSSRHVIIMILRSQQPLLMTAGGIVVLSIQNFGKMLSSAASFFAAMRNFVD